jgi:hypothetical protein
MFPSMAHQVLEIGEMLNTPHRALSGANPVPFVGPVVSSRHKTRLAFHHRRQKIPLLLKTFLSFVFHSTIGS